MVKIFRDEPGGLARHGKDKGEFTDLCQIEAGLEGDAGGMAKPMDREESRENL